jgi:hypothetical protein
MKRSREEKRQPKRPHHTAITITISTACIQVKHATHTAHASIDVSTALSLFSKHTWISLQLSAQAI